MNILKLTPEELKAKILKGDLRPESIKHYEICKALASGRTQEYIAEYFHLTDDSHVRYIKRNKCPDCGKSHKKTN